MDGASKFVRGDAIAGILILAINIVGGLVIGTMQHSLPIGAAADNYVLLAIGDALVAQVPALVISVAAGLIVSRVGDGDDDIGAQVAKQLFSLPRALGLVAVIVGVLGLIPGMPHLAFLTLAAAIGYVAFKLSTLPPPVAEPVAAPKADNGEASWDDVQPVDTLGLEVGYKLIQLVDKEAGGDLLARIKGVRRKFAQEVGFLPPAVHIRDQLDLRPTTYRISLKGVAVGSGEAFPGLWMAIDPGHATAQLSGTRTVDPAFGLPAVWIQQGEREAAQAAGYTVVDASTVIATHLHHLMQVHAW